jgi:YggT family protein
MIVNPFTALLLNIIDLVYMAIFIWFILSLLIQFDVVNRYNPVVNRVYTVLERLIEPLLRPLHRIIPMVAGIDLSPIALILLLRFISNALLYYL